ncbi:unnamed protein product [Paramecium octaurelia]|uniref:Uncharacterized protein n=1 Tax=Paramecium octaurelia TaxID=43137 RepID=A0A8S1Y3B8_PAROT|nr:unnamed protein product [Paramecium octaurelia]
MRKKFSFLSENIDFRRVNTQGQQALNNMKQLPSLQKCFFKPKIALTLQFFVYILIQFSSSLCEQIFYQMIENNMYCFDHIENKILNVCIADHQCQRKLCQDCAHNQQVSSEQLIPITNFPDFILRKMQNLVDANLQQTFQLKKKMTEIQKLLEKLGEQFQKCLSDSQKQIQEILNQINNGDQNYLRLLNYYIKPSEISSIDLELIIRSIHQKKLEQWIIDKKSFLNPITDMQCSIEQHFRDYLTTISEQLKVLLQLNVKIKENKNKNWQEGKIETKGIENNFNLWSLEYQVQKTSLTIEYNNDSEIIYIKDGVKLKKETIKNKLKSFNVIRSLDQIKCLEWSIRDDYNLNYEKCTALYTGEFFQAGGIQTKEGIKIGQWIDLSENFNKSSVTFYKGNYNQDKKVGVWDILIKDIIIGCGVYDDYGSKNGLWVDLHQNFSNNCKILQIGQYQSGKKVAKWEIYYNNLIIGGGMYNKGSKVGKWITLHENFQNSCLVTYSGEYQGRKFGRWDIIYQNEIIGGGLYDRKGQKMGKWIDVHENFFDYCFVLYEGEYVGGKKQGVWNLFMHENQIQTKLGEGNYNKFGQKQGKWVEPFDNFFKGGKIIFIGEYDNGIKIGQWLTYFQEQENQFQQIGGGSYDQNGLKVGIWKDLYEYFNYRSQIIYEGEYQNGTKHRRWKIWYNKFKQNDYQEIGAGEYDKDGMKHGQWIDFMEELSCRDSIYAVEYHHGEIQQKNKLHDLFD